MAIPLCSPIAGQRPHRHYYCGSRHNRSRASGPIGTTTVVAGTSEEYKMGPHHASK